MRISMSMLKCGMIVEMSGTGEGGDCEGFPVPALLIKATQLSSAFSLPEVEFLNSGEKVAENPTFLKSQHFTNFLE